MRFLVYMVQHPKGLKKANLLTKPLEKVFVTVGFLYYTKRLHVLRPKVIFFHDL